MTGLSPYGDDPVFAKTTFVVLDFVIRLGACITSGV
jgi:hypothetical protein